MPEPWTDAEVEAVVRDYFEMLRLEQRGEKYNKAEHNRRLRQVVERSRQSIEFKHCNISAVLTELGLPIIRGYQPRSHYQAALAQAVDAGLLTDPTLHEYLVGEDISVSAAPGTPDDSLRIERPPLIRRPPDDKIVQAVIRKHDPALRDARNRALGTAGEEMIYHFERHRLRSMSRADLADRVRWIARDEGDGAGFDILSFNRSGQERFLEVKTTTGPSTTPFYLTENERRVADEETDRYRLVRLYEFRTDPAAYCLRPPLEARVRLDATLYRATLKGSEADR